MKKFVQVALIAMLASACKKEKGDNSSQDTKINFNGKWLIKTDTTRFIEVAKTNDSTVEITFPKKIDTPPQFQGAITISYKLSESGDTSFCITNNIYPNCFFVKSQTSFKGYISEWLQGPDIGTLKEMTRK